MNIAIVNMKAILVRLMYYTTMFVFFSPRKQDNKKRYHNFKSSKTSGNTL